MLNFLFRGKGVHPKGNKNTADMPTVRIDAFKKVQIPMSMHIGKPCAPIVSIGEEVRIGQKIGDCESYMCVPIHSSISGKVTAVRKILGSAGVPVEVVEIESDGLNSIHDSVKPPIVSDRDSFIKAIRESGLVGLGGASFPTFVKMSPPKGKEPNILIINGAECEPYITSDYRLMIEHPVEIIEGILSTLKWLDIPVSCIGIEDNKADAAKLLKYHIAKLGCSDKVSVKLLKTIYPQGAEKPLIFSTTGRKVPSGGLPYDINVLVLNVATVRYVDKYLKTGMPLTRKNITLDGGALNHPSNVSVPIGAFIMDIVEMTGGVNQTPSKIIMGGPMMGISMDKAEIGIVKASNAILIFDSEQAKVPIESPCIRCSRCVDVCPVNLMPTSIDLATRAGDISELKKFSAPDCIECGCCSYCCPANRYLAQNIRRGKEILRSAGSKN